MAISFRNIHYGGIIMNYACSSRCAHCLYACAPQRDKAYLDEATAERLLDALAAQGCMEVHIGGGEPFLQPEALIRFCRRLRQRGFSVDYVETNSSWATDEKRTRDICRRLREAGVHTLLLSISPYHLGYVPLARVKALMAACRDTGMEIFLWRREFWEELEAMGAGTHSRAEFEAKYGADYWRQFARRYGVGLGGRARETYQAGLPHKSAETVEKQPCRELFNTGHFHMDCYGYYIPSGCTGLGIAVEDLKALPTGKYPLIEALHAGGVAALHRLAKEKFGFTADPAGYIDGCHLCSHIREYLALDAHAACPELHPMDHYRQLRGEREDHR
ncbi:MAG: radical SAM protein [Eubacteriales bacterium]|nr:radical SAM protein [Eubacteriales bacterium]